MSDRRRIGSLFTGYGGLDRGVQSVIGGTVAWVSDIDPGACKILAHRYPGVPNLGEITRVDWAQVEPVDVITGGFPCQDISHAGKRAGLKPGTRSGLWAHMAYAVDTLRPAVVVAENVRGLLSAPADSDVEPCPWCVGGSADGEPALRALGAVLGDLAELGYDTRWVGLRAADVGAPHGRFRVFLTAWPAAATGDAGWVRDGNGSAAADADRIGHERPGSARDGRPGPADSDRHAAADTGGSRSGRDAGAVPRAAAEGRRAGTDVRAAVDAGATAWGDYAPAVARWEMVTGRVAPSPTEPGAEGRHRLSARAVEWLMGLPDGWVTDVPGITRNQALKALGNGVVPQQAAAALEMMT